MADAKKLTITQCAVSEGMVDANGEKYTVMLNPSDFSHDRSISYTNGDEQEGHNVSKAIGKSAVEPKFCGYNPEKYKFSLVIDGTGVLATDLSVKEHVQKLESIVHKYSGEHHEPSVVQVLWGSFIGYGRLDEMKVEYTLFKQGGEPLRAKIELSFGKYVSKEEESHAAKRSSPDLTHLVEVKAGDTLPLLCYRIYKDSSYYKEVARINQIVNFRRLQPGIRLEFPPLR